MKRCIRCGEVKTFDEFSPDKRASDGLFSSCRECNRKAKNKRRSENKESFNEKKKIWRLKNLEKQRAKNREWYHQKAKNNDQWKASHKAHVLRWKANNTDKVREINRRHDLKKMSTPRGRLSHAMSRNIHNSIRRGSKGGRKWESLVGYSTDNLKKHLEKQFTTEMNWGNYGTYWHIDHKIPESAFNFETPEDIDFKKCWSLKNLQPLEAKENMKKSNKLKAEFQPSLTLNIPGVRSYSKRV